MPRNHNSKARRARVIYLHVPRSIQTVTIEVQTVSSGQPDESPMQVSTSSPPPVVATPPSDPISSIDDFDVIYLDGDEF